jgi:hypothetical protein
MWGAATAVWLGGVRRGDTACGVAVWGEAWLCRVRRGYVVNTPDCCTASPGSSPARHPSIGSSQENLGATVQIFPSAAAGVTSAAAGVSTRHQG